MSTRVTDTQARDLAWSRLKADWGSEGWTAGELSAYYGFFLHGWDARYNRQVVLDGERHQDECQARLKARAERGDFTGAVR